MYDGALQDELEEETVLKGLRHQSVESEGNAKRCGLDGKDLRKGDIM